MPTPQREPSRRELLREIESLRREAGELRAAFEDFRLLAEESPNAICIWEAGSGRMRYVNGRFEETFGYARAEALRPGFDLLAATAPDSVEKVQRSHGIHRSGEEHLPFEYTMVARDGRRVDVLLSSRLIVYHGVAAVLGIITDITAQHRLAEELRAAKAGLERQNLELRRLDQVKDDLIREVSHELKTPVAKQAMELELLRSQLGEEGLARVGRRIKVMEDVVRRQQAVIRNLLDLARLKSGGRPFSPVPVRLDEALAGVVEECRPALDAGGFAVSLEAEPLTVLAERDLLWHVFSNLVGNAVKFAAGEGRRLRITAAGEGGRAVVRVEDNGVGLAPEELARVFDRFYRASAAVEGSGVGLPLCRSLLAGVGGTIALASAGRGRGAVATVTLRLA